MARDTVMVIDDDPDFRELVRLVIESLGLHVLEAPDGATAIALARREGPRLRLVLLDYFMPGLAADRCADELRALVGDAPIVLCTAAADPAGRAAQLRLARWLSKPFELHALEEVLETARAA